MADSNTDDLNLLLMEINSHENDWGNQLNANFVILDESITEADTHSTTGGTTALTAADLIAPIHIVTGSLSENAVFTVPPDVTKWYIWKNETVGAFTLTIKTGAGTGVVVDQMGTRMLRCDGANVVDVGIGVSEAQVSGTGSWIGTISGVDTYTAAANGFFTALADGITVSGFFNSANTSPTPTLNYNLTGGKTIVHSDGSALMGGEIPANSVKTFVYRLASDRWFMVGPSISRLPRFSAEIDMGAMNFGGSTTQPHGLGAYPSLVQLYAQCTSANGGHAVGDRIILSGTKDSDNDRGIDVYFTTSVVGVKYGSNPPFVISGGANTAMSESAWKVVARVYR